MVMDAQIESGILSPHNRGGPLNVTNILAAVTSDGQLHLPISDDTARQEGET